MTPHEGGAASDREARALAAIDLPGLLATLSDLVAFDSSGGREVEIQEQMAALLAEAGMETDLWEIDLPALREHPAFAAELDRERALGLVGRAGHGRGPALILNGHVDVVPAGEPERWSSPAFRATLRDDRVFGRGTADMKGGLACAIAAVRALRQAGIELEGSVLIHSVVGEEDGGMGTLATLLRGHTGDAAIVLEPTELVIAPAQAGAANFRITIPGRAAHGALRTEGVDPLERFALIHGAVRQLETERNERLRHPLFANMELPFAICIGTVRAGIWASTVAESLVMEGRFGLAPGEDTARARRELESCIAAAAVRDPWLRDHPPTLEWWGARFEPAQIDSGHRLVTTLSSALTAATDRPARVRGMPYGADMHLLVHEGDIPTVLFGPGDVRTAHAPDEFVPVAELEAVTRTLVLTLIRTCGVHGAPRAHTPESPEPGSEEVAG